jgi:hypothetical protein
MMLARMDQAVREYLASIGRKGGKTLSPKKLAQLKRIAKKPRPGRKAKKETS